MLYQRTIAKEMQLTGIGLHSGQRVTLRLIPAEADHGIKFVRVDLPHKPVIKAIATNVMATDNNTTIGEGHDVVFTVEHLLSVLYGLGINNITCEIDGPEVPIMDGSGTSFVFALKEAGIATLSQTKKFLVVTKKVRVEHEDKWVEIEPADRLIIDSTIVFPHALIKTQKQTFEFSCDNFIREVSRARTFCLFKDVDALKRKGLIKGGSLNNAIVLDDFKVLNEDGLRFDNEPVRHKILDTVGDIALLGHEIAGKITTYKSGHHMHNLLCRELLSRKDAYEIISANQLETSLVESFDLPQSLTPAYH